MTEQLLTVEEAAKIVPLSKTTLYRVAQRGDGPFLKVEGRWMVYTDELHAWVCSHRRQPSESPMPRSRSARGGSVMARVHELRRTG